MSRFALQARWVLPVDSRPIADGVVTVCEGRIELVGNRPASGAPVCDLGDVVLMPGLVNAHTHLEFSGLEEPLGQSGMSLPDWIRLVIATRGRSQTSAKQAIEVGLRESSLAGVTTLGEIATTAFDYRSATGFPSVLAFQEVIGFSAARLDSVFSDVEQRLEKHPCGAASENRLPSELALKTRELQSLDLLEEIVGSCGISPHAPYTVHPLLVSRLVDLACKRQIPVAMHLAESPEELELLESGSGVFRDLLAERSMWDEGAIPRGTKPLDYLKVLAKAPRALAIHGNYFSSEEIDFLAHERERMSVVYCPRTHAFFGHEKYPLEEMLDAGVRVVLGTDSRASNPNLCLLSEMRYVAKHYPQVETQQIFRMGTLAGAQAIGRGDEVGSLAPGKWADMTAIPCGESRCEPEAEVLHGDALPVETWLRGQAR